MSTAFFWMGIACTLNAKRCKRRHCYYLGPIFCIGAILVLLVGFKVLHFGPDGLIMTVSGTLVLALMTYLIEPIFGTYVK